MGSGWGRRLAVVVFGSSWEILPAKIAHWRGDALKNNHIVLGENQAIGGMGRDQLEKLALTLPVIRNKVSIKHYIVIIKNLVEIAVPKTKSAQSVDRAPVRQMCDHIVGAKDAGSMWNRFHSLGPGSAEGTPVVAGRLEP